MNSYSCYLCGESENTTRPGRVRDNPNIKILECASCGLVYLSSISHIAENHYEKSGMHDGEVIDVQSWLKDTQADDERRFNFIKDKLTDKKVLDFGCGIGGFIEMAKSTTDEIAGVELEENLQPSFKERGLNVYPNLQSVDEANTKYDVLTAFHVVEHLSDPIDILKELATLLDEDGEMIVEVPSSDDALLTVYDCKPFQEFTYWSQHLFLFNASTFNDLVKKAGLKLNWIKHIQRYPLSNHLYWLSHGKPGGHQEWDFLNDQNLNKEYENRLAALGKTDTIIAGISK